MLSAIMLTAGLSAAAARGCTDVPLGSVRDHIRAHHACTELWLWRGNAAWFHRPEMRLTMHISAACSGVVS